jgi:hypothetical protein
MPLIFPGWKSIELSSIQEVDFSVWAEAKYKVERKKVRAAVEPLYVVRLDESHAVLLTAAREVGAGTEPFGCHACDSIVGANFFELTESGWKLQARNDAIARSGSFGDIGKTEIHRIAGSQFAFTAEWGSCWQGYCGSWLVLVGLKPGMATLLSPGVPLSAENDGAYGACSALDAKPAIVSEEEPRECFDVKGAWKIQGERLVMNFKGRLNEFGPDGKLMPLQQIDRRVVYQINSEQLKLFSGGNPVPKF